MHFVTVLTLTLWRAFNVSATLTAVMHPSASQFTCTLHGIRNGSAFPPLPPHAVSKGAQMYICVVSWYSDYLLGADAGGMPPLISSCFLHAARNQIWLCLATPPLPPHAACKEAHLCLFCS